MATRGKAPPAVDGDEKSLSEMPVLNMMCLLGAPRTGGAASCREFWLFIFFIEAKQVGGQHACAMRGASIFIVAKPHVLQQRLSWLAGWSSRRRSRTPLRRASRLVPAERMRHAVMRAVVEAAVLYCAGGLTHHRIPQERRKRRQPLEAALRPHASLPADEPPKGVIDLNESLSIKEIADHPKYECLFVVYTKTRNFYLAAYSKAGPNPAASR